ncbi:hypothetical protein STAFG_8484 [Streptomyces afghaniensis 772]|uniref:Uncharacterized protein n=1 Tax=Streptomyces afghaniensis 772 TaxID=1283301 RepID=S4M5F8_9ACTN|nr:hypothetical protein STAFG_8484 [Streptomyces afghaniensis 772]
MHPTAELIGATAALVALGILTLASVRSISRRKEVSAGTR